MKAYPELLRAAGYYTYTDNKLDYQFSRPCAHSGPSTIWDRGGRRRARLGAQRAPGQPFFGLINFQVTHESGMFRPLGSTPHSAMHFAMQVLRWWPLDGPCPRWCSRRISSCRRTIPTRRRCARTWPATTTTSPTWISEVGDDPATTGSGWPRRLHHRDLDRRTTATACHGPSASCTIQA